MGCVRRRIGKVSSWSNEGRERERRKNVTPHKIGTEGAFAAVCLFELANFPIYSGETLKAATQKIPQIFNKKRETPGTRKK